MSIIKYQTLDDVLLHQSRGSLKDWAISYLKGEGGNPKLATHIESRPASKAIMTQSPLHRLKRGMGPEITNKWQEDEAIFERRVTAFQSRIQQGILPLPIMLTDFWPDMLVVDGNHRLEALRRENRTRYWVIYICQNPDNFQRLLRGQNVLPAATG